MSQPQSLPLRPTCTSTTHPTPPHHDVSPGRWCWSRSECLRTRSRRAGLSLCGWAIVMMASVAQYVVSRPILPATYLWRTKEGDLRFAHARQREYCEAVAFYGGQAEERCAQTGAGEGGRAAAEGLLWCSPAHGRSDPTVPVWWVALFVSPCPQETRGCPVQRCVRLLPDNVANSVARGVHNNAGGPLDPYVLVAVACV
jgi:hypothetical protein